MATRNSTSTRQPKAQGNQKTVAQPEIRGLWIEAVSEQGRYRAGIHWPREGQGIALDGLPESQIHALHSDPMLKVKEVVFSDTGKEGVINYEQAPADSESSP